MHKLIIVLLTLTLFISCSDDSSDEAINPSENEVIEEVNNPTLLVNISEAILQTCNDQYTVTLLIGHDVNMNQLLDDSEIQIEEWFCIDNSEESIIYTIDDFDISACDKGGTRVKVGNDIDQNSILIENEVLKEYFVCLDDFQKRPTSNILNIDGDLSDADVEKLVEDCFGVHITEIRVINTNNLRSLDLSMVVSINSIVISDNLSLETINLGNLNRANQIIIERNSSIKTIDLITLKEARDIQIEDANDALDALSFDSLIAVEEISIISNGLSKLFFPQLEVANNIFIEGEELIELKLDKLSGAPNTNYTENVSSLDYRIFANNLTSFKLNEVVKNNNLSISVDSKVLFSFEMSAVTALKNLVIGDEVSGSNVNEVNLPELRTVESLTVHGSDFPLAINSLESGSISLYGLSELQLNSLDSGSLLVEKSSLDSINISSIREAGSIKLNECLNLEMVNISNLNYIQSSIQIINNPKLTEIILTSINSVVDNSIIDLQRNSVSSNHINSILDVLARSNMSSGFIFLGDQNPAAPPNSQGLLDVQTLRDRGNTVSTD